MNRRDIPQSNRIRQMLDDARPLIYLASDYSDPDPEVRACNVMAAQKVGAEINETGEAFAVLPLNASIGVENSLEPVAWYAFTFQLMQKCDAVVALLGVGVGREDEIYYARNIMGVPVHHYTDCETLISWLKVAYPR